MVGAVGARIPCIGCSAPVSAEPGPAHAYIGASPGCWRIYGAVLAREYGEYGYPPCHRLTVDAYAAQHPGTPSRRSIRSVAVHLISLHLMLDRDFTAAAATAAIRDAVRDHAAFTWLQPPSFAGSLTILDVAEAQGLDEHQRMVTRWAESVWNAWAGPHGGAISAWAAAVRR